MIDDTTMHDDGDCYGATIISTCGEIRALSKVLARNVPPFSRHKLYFEFRISLHPLESVNLFSQSNKECERMPTSFGRSINWKEASTLHQR